MVGKPTRVTFKASFGPYLVYHDLCEASDGGSTNASAVAVRSQNGRDTLPVAKRMKTSSSSEEKWLGNVGYDMDTKEYEYEENPFRRMIPYGNEA